MTLETLSSARSFGGTQLACRHASRETGTDMMFGIYLPPQAEAGDAAARPLVPLRPHLHPRQRRRERQYQRVCAELGLILVAPDTSPRGADVPDSPDYDFGQGAGFYVDATEAPFANELPDGQLRHRRASRPGRRAFPRRHGPPGDHRPFDGRPRRPHPRPAQSRPLPERLRLRADRRARARCRGARRRSAAISARTAPPGAPTTPSP